MNKRSVGNIGEKMALAYLRKQGYELVKKNYRCPYGEIDIIARHQNTLVFIEVKYRRSTAYGYPMEAVNGYKQQKIYKTALWFISSEQIEGAFRFDVISILGDDINHIVNAFQ